MSPNRREFIRFVVAGSIAAGCPFEWSLLAAPVKRPLVEGEQFDVCHQLRDARQFQPSRVTRRCDVVIVGGGVAGLSAAHFLQKHDFLLLEKEAHWGGNAYLEEYNGQAYGTGSAFEFAGGAGDLLAQELGLKLLPVNSPDPTLVNGVFVEDTWRSGLDQLPYPAPVRAGFKKFRDTLMRIEAEKHAAALDNEPFSKYTVGYPPQVRRWWDAYGPSNWGARTADTSALVGIEALQGLAGDEPDSRVTLPGGLGAITKRLAEVLLPKHRERMHNNATVVAVEPLKREVQVTYVRGRAVETVTAKAVIMATPKFITARLVAGLPNAQKLAMQRIRYAPYPVVNIIFDRPIFRRAYDTWAPGKSFTDFIVADWVVRNQPGYQLKENILTFYTPLPESERARLLTEDGCRELATAVLRDFQGLMPEFRVDPVEVHIYRRGHPMFAATPGTYSRWIPAARRPMQRIFFGNTDSEGPESLTSGAITASRAAAEWFEKLLANSKPR